MTQNLTVVPRLIQNKIQYFNNGLQGPFMPFTLPVTSQTFSHYSFLICSAAATLASLSAHKTLFLRASVLLLLFLEI